MVVWARLLDKSSVQGLARKTRSHSLVSQIDHLLEAQLQDATLDSHGNFSLSLSEAWRKMGSSAGSHPQQWILSAVQAFCACRASAIFLVQKGAEIWLLAHHCKQDLSPQEFLALSAENLLTQTATGLLGRALAGAMAQHPQRLLLCHWSEGAQPPEVASFVSSDKKPGVNPLLPSSGSALAIYCHSASKLGDLRPLLGYSLQFCPISVRYLSHGMLLKSDYEARTLHWIQQTPNCPLYAKSEQVEVSIPLLIDAYAADSTPQLLLKPPGGYDITYFADWIDKQGEFDWLRPPGLSDGTCTQGRYFTAYTRPLQELRYQASKNIGNSWFSEKGERSHVMLATTGDFILFLESRPGPDRILPIQHGLALKSLEGRLNIPGVVVVAGADELACDLGGLSLLRDQQLDVWIDALRERVRQTLQNAVNQPPQARGRLSVLKTVAATGATAALALCLDGIQPGDLETFFKVGLFGGAGLYTTLGFLRHYAPDSWFKRQTRNLRAELQKRLDAVPPKV